ncbi:Serine/threonine-protein kinase flr-4 [Rhizoctonia solani]|uniref:Serine/threonine-protein kinase flr-4 n=1 Tax=Rhizoctonia solani TaxID=456999 RepID=A0A0K6FV53_9AGAM|nr:Serine/threonine-protein kinase flr-4 [Rhizoctonia solani]
MILHSPRITDGWFRDFEDEHLGGDRDSEVSEDDSEYDEATTWNAFVKTYRNKVSEWEALRHLNIVRVYAHEEDLNLHVEYCSKGSARDFLKTPAGKEVNKIDMISDILAGLEYLHTLNPPIVHGNINTGKLFIDSAGRTKIGEFGLAALCYPLAPLASAITFTGFSRWMSPELLDMDPDDETPTVPSMPSDIWALGCTIFEIIADKLPYFEYTHDIKIQRAILKGETPGSRHSLVGDDAFGCRLWPILESCWLIEPSERPPIQRITSRFASLSS